jgi:hypothetical protein
MAGPGAGRGGTQCAAFSWPEAAPLHTHLLSSTRAGADIPPTRAGRLPDTPLRFRRGSDRQRPWPVRWRSRGRREDAWGRGWAPAAQTRRGVVADGGGLNLELGRNSLPPPGLGAQHASRLLHLNRSSKIDSSTSIPEDQNLAVGRLPNPSQFAPPCAAPERVGRNPEDESGAAASASAGAKKLVLSTCGVYSPTSLSEPSSRHSGGNPSQPRACFPHYLPPPWSWLFQHPTAEEGYRAGVKLLTGARMRLARGYVEELITGVWGDPLWCGSCLAAVTAAAPPHTCALSRSSSPVRGDPWRCVRA